MIDRADAPCPVDGCRWRFISSRAAARHVRRVHGRGVSTKSDDGETTDSPAAHHGRDGGNHPPKEKPA